MLIEDEKLILLKKVVEIVDGWVLIVVGIGLNSIVVIIVFIKKVSQIKGIDVVLVVVFYYNKFD